MYFHNISENWSQKQDEARQRLEMLRQLGYGYIVTKDDGDTWVGAKETGLEISELLRHGAFLGEVHVRGETSA